LSSFEPDRKRRVVPRWREAHLSVPTGELTPLPTGTAKPEADPEELNRRQEEWDRNHSIPFAADLAGVALTLGVPERAHDAAAFLLREGVASSNPALASLANAVLGNRRPNPPPTTRSATVLIQAIRDARARLRSEPRNGLLWVDLARHYTVLGQPDSAASAMRRGLAIFPESRFVLRSAARLHIHIGNHEYASELLRKSPRTPHDPWLIAAETAVSTILGRSPKHIRQARAFIGDENLARRHLTELAAALGTVELTAGKRSEARKLLRLALADPTDNSLAQVRWLANVIPNLAIDPTLLAAPWTYEARALEHFSRQEWAATMAAAVQWFNDEPFSSRPARMATFVGPVLLEDYDTSVRLAVDALRASPKEQGLRNNLVFALVSGGQLDDAIRQAALVEEAEMEPRLALVWQATRGALAFRKGEAEIGRTLYRNTIQAAVPDDLETAGFAAAFLAREEFLAGTNEWQPVLSEAIELAGRAKSTTLSALISRLSRVLDHATTTEPPQVRLHMPGKPPTPLIL
jgi:tetratricopeptide (TPR) repeat protein